MLLIYAATGERAGADLSAQPEHWTWMVAPVRLKPHLQQKIGGKGVTYIVN
jgi:hypothetical protein